jgi:predicted anti-sigma-YlaC factor YlaD
MSQPEPMHSEHESCQHLLHSLGEYVDGSLGGELCAVLEKHLKDCPRCRVVVNTLKKTVELYHETATETQIPDDVRRRLYLKLHLDEYLK